MKRIVPAIVLATLVGSAIGILPAHAGACYEEREVGLTLVCGGGIRGNSADFSTGCTYVPAAPVMVEAPCPGMWVNATDKRETHAHACGRVGLKPADLDGQVCASGDFRPTEGTGFESIRYRYGRGPEWARRASGGTLVHRYTGMFGLASYGCWNPAKGAPLFLPDTEKTGDVVAYYCGP